MKTNDTILEKTGKVVDLITKYGTHNFNLTRILLDDLEETIIPYHGEIRSQPIEELKD